MGKIILYIAQSLNGKIAKLDGDVEWLNEIPNPDNTDYGFNEFFESIGITIQGYKTYKQIIDWGIEFPYKGKINYVFTRKTDLVNTENVSFISVNHIEFVRNLKKQFDEDIWLIGGGQINTLFFNEKLIDEIYVFIMPVVLPDGIEIFEMVPNETQLELFDSTIYTTGAAELKYKIRE